MPTSSNQPEPTDELEITSESGPLPSPPPKDTDYTNIKNTTVLQQLHYNLRTSTA